jgi:hypothetical protein
MSAVTTPTHKGSTRFTITMNKKIVKAGTYVITIHDLASIHDFHLTGTGPRHEDERLRHRHDEVGREVEEGDIPLRVRPAPHDHARRPQRHVTPTHTTT